ncbi:MarR family winged helix-turn-helix transcriptional regulator [Streptomyces palmae]|uniref:MarR family transcriptional regulator n=1 Tax=Streptomyces palmae TaxID=1701085 RepID=A0A4Z0GUV7_9ACTN|nr:MarR family transcriptional regulator [Streptomyces palmae]
MPELSNSDSSAKEPPERRAPAEGIDAALATGDTVGDAEAVDLLRSSVMRLGRRLKHQRVDESLSPTEMSVLGTLARCGSATPGELARKEHVQPPSMTRIVALLESKGLVRLEPHPEDRRQKVVSQTEQAEAMLEESRRKRNAWLAELAGKLDAEDWTTLRAAAPVLEKLANL